MLCKEEAEMESYLFRGLETGHDTLVVEGWHKPGSLTIASGAWISSAGNAVLEAGKHDLIPHDNFVWVCVESGRTQLRWTENADNPEAMKTTLDLVDNDTFILPAGSASASLTVDTQAVLLWMAIEGPLSATVVRKMGALLHVPLKQRALPSQTYLSKQIVQVVVRHTGTSNATYQLQHLMYGMLASQWGQPVAMDAMLSHEIAKVVDTLRAGQYKDNFSLAEMAAISRVPMETFRKRFVSEVGMPPLSYVLHCKMERAKELLRDQNYSVREAGAEVGMRDPYHFSKQFKNIVGISPSAFIKQAAEPGVARPPRKREKKSSNKPQEQLSMDALIEQNDTTDESKQG